MDVARTGAENAARAGTAVERRWAVFHRWGSFALLGAGLLFSAATSRLIGMDGPRWAAVGALATAAVVLQLWWLAAARERPGPSARSTVYYAVRWALAFALTWLNPFFATYATAGYYDAERLLPRRLRWPGMVATAVTLAGSQSGGFPPRGTTGMVVFGGLLTVHLVLLVVLSRVAAQEAERARVQAAAIEELARANAALQQALAENAALHAQLLVQAREAGVADERTRMAAEIHDTIAQGLAGIVTQLQAGATAPDPAAARGHLDRAADLARHSLGEARRSVRNLSPAALEHDTLPGALRKTVAEWRERTGVQAEFTVTGTVEELHGEIAATLLRIGQEALANAARHAQATRLGLTLSFIDDEVVLDVRDDGRGFDPLALPTASARAGTGGFGLSGMRARAERIAGTVTVESEPGFGTAVSARVPLVPHER
ncbi:sensor histidine kinase [Streptomyces sp. CB01881]|nr:sensor histidine kinase [Streptomyces sp. CB01881]TYC77949.1 sensor histidine kinase [Streptomyces sp. CB01881]